MRLSLTMDGSPDLSVLEDKSDIEHKKQDHLEEALMECKLGWFNLRVLIASIAAAISLNSVSVNTSFLMPSAECDLRMSMEHKGVLSATPFAGMLISAFFAGFVIDAFGRRIFLVTGYFLLFLIALYESLSQNYLMLVSGKFIEGMVVGVVATAQIVYISEVTPKRYRDTVILMNSMLLGIGNTCVALISWGMLTKDWSYSAHGFEMHNWNFYLIACGSINLIAASVYCFLPESPKFLYAQNDSKGVEKSLEKIYTLNTGKPANTLHLGSLLLEMKKTASNKSKEILSLNKRIMKVLNEAGHTLGERPNIFYLILLSLLQLFIMLAFNTLRLWYPQISTIIEYFDQKHGETAEYCTMIDYYTDNANTTKYMNLNTECLHVKSGFQTYKNSIIMGSTGIVTFIFSGILVQFIEKRRLLSGLCFGSCIFTFILLWGRSHWQILILSCGIVSLSQTNMALVQSFGISIFPTSVRSLAVSIIMSSGRIGTLVGNVMFPALLKVGCVLPVSIISGILLAAFTLTLFIQKGR